MSERELEGILGAPIRVRSWGPDGGLHDYAVRGATGQGIVVWVHVKDHPVVEVQATQHFLVRDSQALYMLGAGEPAYERNEFAAALSHQRGRAH